MWHINIAPLLCCLFLSACFYPVENFEARADMTSSLDLSIPLDVAITPTNPQRFAVRGKYIQIDPGSTGQANLRINSVSDTPRLAYPGQQFSPGEFTDLYFDYTAQPGKFLHVVYGDAPDILSAGAKSLSDSPVAPLSYLDNKATIGAGIGFSTIAVVALANNTSGIKISGGVLFMGIISNGVNAASGYSELQVVPITAGNLKRVATASILFQAGEAGTFDVSITIPQIYIPPGYALIWSYTSFGIASLYEQSIILNYELLM